MCEDNDPKIGNTRTGLEVYMDGSVREAPHIHIYYSSRIQVMLSDGAINGAGSPNKELSLLQKQVDEWLFYYRERATRLYHNRDRLYEYTSKTNPRPQMIVIDDPDFMKEAASLEY